MIFRQREITLFFRLFTNAYLNQRVTRLKETLGKLDALSYENKDHRPEVFALLGQICGQIKPLVTDYPGLQESYDQLFEYVERRKRLSESVKRRIAYELHGFLDATTFDEQSRTMGKKLK